MGKPAFPGMQRFHLTAVIFHFVSSSPQVSIVCVLLHPTLFFHIFHVCVGACLLFFMLPLTRTTRHVPEACSQISFPSGLFFIPWRACQQRSCSDAFIHSFPWGQKFILSHPCMSFCRRHHSNTYRRLFVFYFNLPNVCEWCEGGLVPGISFTFDLEPN